MPVAESDIGWMADYIPMAAKGRAESEDPERIIAEQKEPLRVYGEAAKADYADIEEFLKKFVVKMDSMESTAQD